MAARPELLNYNPPLRHYIPWSRRAASAVFPAHGLLALLPSVGSVLQALYSLKAQLDDLPLEDVAPQPRQAALTISEDTLLPLIGASVLCHCCAAPTILLYVRLAELVALVVRVQACAVPLPAPAEDEMDSLAHSWQDRWQHRSLPSFTQRARAEAAARRAALHKDGVFGASSTFDDIAAATEEAAGMVSSWEHDGSAPAPWAVALSQGDHACATDGAADGGVDPRPGMLLREKLRLLRGSLLQAAKPAPGLAVADSLRSNQADCGTCSRLDAAASRLTASGAGSSAGATLQGLLAYAADYTSMRVQHMRELLLPDSAPPAVVQQGVSLFAPAAA